MNIDEIRAEIPKANLGRVQWIRDHGEPDYPDDKYPFEDIEHVIEKFVDWAYEAGIEQGGKNSLSALNEVGLRENPIYQKGYEAAAKDPKAWYVLDKHGEQVHIGDIYKRGTIEETVDELGLANDGHPSINGHYADCCEKVTLDTREKIIEDLAIQFSAIENDGIVDVDDDLRAFAEQIVARVEALRAVDA